jgi:Tol biopolymer transport system component
MRILSSCILLSVFLFAFCSTKQAQTNPGKIVFSDEFWRLIVINGDGTGQTLLTAGVNLKDSRPAYSPDGQKIAFDRNSSGTPNVFVMNSDGTNPVAVASAGHPNPSFSSDPTWSPDGTKLAFVSARNGGGRKEIYVINVDGTGLVQLTTNVQLTSDGQGAVYSQDIDPSWSPDGLSIAFASNRDGISNLELYVMNSDGSNQRRLTNVTNDDRYPTWSPDSQLIAFYRNGGAGIGINIMDRDGSNVVNVTHDGSAPSWSPDGLKFAFSQNDPSIGYKPAIFVINADGTGSTKITNNTFGCSTPAWAPTSSTPVPTSAISGHVLDAGSMPINGAMLTLSGTLGRTTESDATGAYAFSGLPVGNYSISISKAGLGFTPTTVSFNDLTTDQIADFVAFTAFSIRGQITGLGGNIIVVNLSGSQNRSVQTDPSGNYSFDLLPAGGSYTVSFNTQIWNISPNGATFNNLSSNQTANFNAVRFNYTISGKITRLGNPLPGINVALDNLSGFTPPTTTTDANGHYSFTNVVAGINYQIRPTAANYLFDPQTRDFNQLDSDKSADFIGLSTNHLLFDTRYVLAGQGNCLLVLTVFRGGNAQGVGPITVRYATSDGNATAGVDYVAVSGTLNFPEGTYSQTIEIPFIPSEIVDGPRIFSVTLSNPTGNVDLGDPRSVTVVLTAPASPSSIVLATQPNSNRAVALNSTNLLAEPFTLSTPMNFSSDTKTRVSFFVSGVQFKACQGTTTLFYDVTDSQQNHSFGMVEGIFKLPGNNPYLQLSVPLPQGLVSGDLTFSFTLGNLISNTARISVQP